MNKRLRLSLRWRLLAATLVALGIALVLAGVVLYSLFQEYALRQFKGHLQSQLDQLTTLIELAPDGVATLDENRLSDPRWHRPFSGLYWQLDAGSTQGLLRSRSLWDTTLLIPADALNNGEVHAHRLPGPQDSSLLVLERSLHPAADPRIAWRLIVAGDTGPLEQASADFRTRLAASLAVLLVLLLLAGWAQVAVGLRPLRQLQQALRDVHAGRTENLQGDFPTELKPLVEDFNRVLTHDAELVERARHHTGNLAHALKTPLAVLHQAAVRAEDTGVATPSVETAALASLVREQVEQAQRHLNWHLARARAIATQGRPGQRSELAPALEALVRTMARVHAERGLQIRVEPQPLPQNCAFAGEETDLLEMLGNLLDNACKWARHQILVQVSRPDGSEPRWCITIDDDGPGLPPDLRQQALARGARLDETVPGSGLGLAIVNDLALAHHGALALDQSPRGGLRATLTLPAAE